MRYTGPKDRLSRREGFDIFNAGAKLTRLTTPPGVHGPKGATGSSQFGKQLREKQKVKRMYGMQEKQFAGYMNEAFKSKGNTGEALLVKLERRLDNVVYRLGFSASRPQARQTVSHRHVLVNGKKLNIPSYQVNINDVISVDQKVKVIEKQDHVVPGWIEKQATSGKVVRLPKREDIPEVLSEQDIVEFYSR